jgi:curli production assembly/transport component CsgF
MMSRSATACLGVVFLCGLLTTAKASPLQYQPVNPTFGGNPLNGSFLLGTANANNYRYLNNPQTQNQFNQQQSTADQMRQALVSSLISQATQTAINSILGTNGTARDSGVFSVAGETIAFNRVGGQINITLTDPGGSQTQVSVPVPQF